MQDTVRDPWEKCTEQAHKEIWKFHKELVDQNIPHIFFNGNNDFSSIQDRQDWSLNYIGPYDPASTYHARLQAAEIQTVTPDSYHYGRDGHSWWFRYLLSYLMFNKFI